MSFIHHTANYRQYCHAGKKAIDCRLGVFQGADFAGHLSDSKSTSGGVLCILGIHIHICSDIMGEQKANSGIWKWYWVWNYIAGWRFLYERYPRAEFMGQCCLIFYQDTKRNLPLTEHSNHNAEFIQQSWPNAQLFGRQATLCIFGDHEAVTKQINTGRSPTMRHTYRTHTVNLHWLYDRIKLDATIKIEYVSTIPQLRRHICQRFILDRKMGAIVDVVQPNATPHICSKRLGCDSGLFVFLSRYVQRKRKLRWANHQREG